MHDEPMEKHVGGEVRILSNMIHRRILSLSEPEYEGVTGTNGWILGYLARNADRDVFQRELEECFSVRRATISKTLGLMEQKGLIERSSVENDARRKKLRLTEKGRRLNDEMIAQFQRVEREITEGVPEEKLAEFFEVCAMIKENLCRLEENSQ